MSIRDDRIAALEREIGQIAAAILAMSGEIEGTVRRTIRAELSDLTPAPVAPPDGVANAEAVAASEPVGAAPAPPPELHTGNFSLIRESLHELVERIELTRGSVASMHAAEGHSDHITAATAELGNVVQQTEQATQHILGCAEAIQALCDSEADRGLDPLLYQSLSEQVIQIMTACGFQDLTGQRISAAVATLLHVEAELKRLVELWEIEEGTAMGETIRTRPDDDRPDKDLLHGPQDAGAMDQDAIDKMMFG